MATKRAKKKTAKKRATRKTAAPRRKTPARSKQTKQSHWLRKCLILLALIALITGGIYYFGSFETRAKMEQLALSTLNVPRTHAATPAPIAACLDLLYDTIPSSEGMVVEGGELGRNENSPFLAGVPHSRDAIRALSQPSYTNLFSKNRLQAATIALRLDDAPRQHAKADDKIQIDARVTQLKPEALIYDEWRPQPIAPAKALAGQYGARGASDAQLATNYAPMIDTFAKSVWAKAMREFTVRYPKRFGEIWIYLGPVYHQGNAKLPSGILIPDSFYAIALDITDEGGLRALALRIPSTAESKNLNEYLTSISEIEAATGLQFLPGLDFSIRDTLGNYVSPSVW
jgi:endonuclease G